ncbi:MarR family winged helix-turn-helix transcriptional regulator [Phaeacidiphilus oryzae]|uniref:MarR family winged helix-turn-helix transcriptional regulator n=1 Tax=Phaeacidiphilus oryzae TaxID=348818 RepID=UPI000AAF804B|nr:MarR family transcriptional regulator [Phaeacidiphilus oryzae]
MTDAAERGAVAERAAGRKAEWRAAREQAARQLAEREQAEREQTERRVWDAMRTLVLEKEDRRREAAEELGMSSFLRVKALRRLAARGPLTMSQLSLELATDKPYTTVLVDGLEERGLVARTPHPEDRRRRMVALTEAGRVEAERALEILGRPPVALASFSESELALLDGYLARLLRA